MSIAGAAAALRDLPGVSVREAEPLARHANLRLGGPVELWIGVADEEALVAAAAILGAEGVRWRLVHGLTDLVVSDDGLAGALVRPGPGFSRVEAVAGGIRAGVGAPLARVGWAARASGLGDLARLETSAGTVGEWLGSEARPRLGPAVRGIRVLKRRVLADLPGDRLPGLPSSAVVVAVDLVGPLPRGVPLPAPPGALATDPTVARLLARSGLLGLRIRSLRLPEAAPGTVAALTGATARDLAFLARIVEDRLMRDHGFRLETRLAPAGRPPSRRTRGWTDVER